MYLEVLALIPARGGSKGILRKNLKELCGKPLIQHTIDIAKKIKSINKIVVSTDDKEIASVSEMLGASVVMRPKELSGDTSLVKDAIQYTVHELERKGYTIKYILLLEATSPLRKVKDIESCIEAMKNNNVDSVATFSTSCISPGRLWRIEDGSLSPYIEGENPWLPRQQQPQAYELNGLVYGFTRESLEKYADNMSLLVGNIMPVVTDGHVVDIDTEIDFSIVEKIMEIENEKA